MAAGTTAVGKDGIGNDILVPCKIDLEFSGNVIEESVLIFGGN